MEKNPRAPTQVLREVLWGIPAVAHHGVPHVREVTPDPCLTGGLIEKAACDTLTEGAIKKWASQGNLASFDAPTWPCPPSRWWPPSKHLPPRGGPGAREPRESTLSCSIAQITWIIVKAVPRMLST